MNFNKTIKINDKIISNNSPTFIIAEAGVNHGGDMTIAKKLIDLAADSGADAVKFQHFKAEHLILDNVKKAPYQLKTTNNDETQVWDMGEANNPDLVNEFLGDQEVVNMRKEAGVDLESSEVISTISKHKIW